MDSPLYRYKFADRVDLADAEETLLLSILATEGLYGQARVRMDAGYAIGPAIGVIVVDASTDVGRAVNGIFTSFLMREFGPESFGVKRVAGLSEVRR